MVTVNVVLTFPVLVRTPLAKLRIQTVETQIVETLVFQPLSVYCVFSRNQQKHQRRSTLITQQVQSRKHGHMKEHDPDEQPTSQSNNTLPTQLALHTTKQPQHEYNPWGVGSLKFGIGTVDVIL